MKYQVRCDNLPLTVYREVAAHLTQVDGVKVELMPQHSYEFDYRQSQVGGLLVCYPDGLSDADGERVRQILMYYSDRYGAWTTIES